MIGGHPRAAGRASPSPSPRHANDRLNRAVASHNPPAAVNDQQLSARPLRHAVRVWAGGNRYLDSTYSYDAYGNALTATVYNAYGSGGSLASADARTTATAYDAHGLFPCRAP